jgi:hypothetical protein
MKGSKFETSGIKDMAVIDENKICCPVRNNIRKGI